MGYQPRILEKFTDMDGVSSYTFNTADFEQEMSGAFSIARQGVIGGNYGYLHRTAAPVREPASVRLRFSVVSSSPSDVDTEVDNLAGVLYRVGLGKLFTVDSAGARRWCKAILAADPQVSWRAGDIFRKGIGLDFLRFSDWFAEAATEDTAVITSTNTTFEINNPGTLPSRFVVIRLRANTAGGFTNPKLVNETNGYEFETSRDSASSNDEVKLDTEEPSVGYSTNDGVSYTDDFANLVLPDGHPPLAFPIEPGINTIRITNGGTPDLDVDWSLYATYPAG